MAGRKNHDSLEDALRRLETEAIERGGENAPLAPVGFEFRPLTEKEKKEFRNSRLPESNKDRELTNVPAELDSKADIT